MIQTKQNKEQAIKEKPRIPRIDGYTREQLERLGIIRLKKEILTSLVKTCTDEKGICCAMSELSFSYRQLIDSFKEEGRYGLASKAYESLLGTFAIQNIHLNTSPIVLRDYYSKCDSEIRGTLRTLEAYRLGKVEYYLKQRSLRI